MEKITKREANLIVRLIEGQSISEMNVTDADIVYDMYMRFTKED
jgi:hypothetical protein